MDENQQNQPPQNPPQAIPEKRNLFVAFLAGVGSSAMWSFVSDFISHKQAAKNGRLFSPSSASTKGRIAVGIGAAAAIFQHYLNKRDEKNAALIQQIPAQPPTPPSPPSFGDRPNGLELTNVPQILDILVADGDLTREQQAKVLGDIKGGRKGFAAQMAVEDGLITPAQADTALGQQAMLKAAAAAQDIQNIKDYGTLPAAPFLKANWGNNGVNPAAAAPTRTDGVSAAANAAQNLVMIANANPALAPQLFNGVIAAASLANGIALGDSAVTPLAKMSAAWQQTMNDALSAAAAASPQAMVDANGKPINVQDFIAARGAEISAAVAETLRNPPQQGKGNGR